MLKKSNKLLIIFLTFAIALIYATSVKAYLVGDVNQDREITAEDARLITQAAVSIIRLTSVQSRLADIDNDGIITCADARLCLRKAIGLEVNGGFYLRDTNSKLKNTGVTVLGIGNQTTISPLYYPYNIRGFANIAGLSSWTNTNATVAKSSTSNYKAIITAKRAGKTIITAKSNYSSYRNVIDKYTIYVKKKEEANRINNVLAKASEISNYIKDYSYGHQNGNTPQGMRNQNNVNCISYVSWVFYEAGYLDKIYTSCGTCINDSSFLNKFRKLKSWEELEPGDIVFYGNHEHAEIYAGNGYTFNGGSQKTADEPQIRRGDNGLPYSSGLTFSYAYRLK